MPYSFLDHSIMYVTEFPSLRCFIITIKDRAIVSNDIAAGGGCSFLAVRLQFGHVWLAFYKMGFLSWKNCVNCK